MAGKSAISQALPSLGSAPLKALWVESVGLIPKNNSQDVFTGECTQPLRRF
jgi:hypothetical protein